MEHSATAAWKTHIEAAGHKAENEEEGMTRILILHRVGLSGVLGAGSSGVCFTEDAAGQPYLCINSLLTLPAKARPQT